QIPANTPPLAAGGYVTFDDAKLGFGLSGTNGDSVYLVRGTKGDKDVKPGGTITHFIDDVHFRATENGVSLGRMPNGSGRLTPLAATTLGSANAATKVGSVVISEINYNPSKSDAALAADPTLETSDLEYIEFRNTTTGDINMSGWRLRGGVDYDFPVGTTLKAGEMLVLLKFNPDDPENINQVNAFKAQYGVGDSVVLMGGYSGLINNSDDRLLLLRPDNVPDADPVYVQVDEVLFDDQAPWPTNADGSVASHAIHRNSNGAYGNVGTSWTGAVASPGTASIVVGGDLNGDGVVTVADIDAMIGQMHAAAPDLRFDLNGDSKVDVSDLDILVRNDIGTVFGDVDLDGKFDSHDLVLVFQVGEYEDGIAGNSSWADGDWDGDGDFTTSDFTFALQNGLSQTVLAARAQAVAVEDAAAATQQTTVAVVDDINVDVISVQSGDDVRRPLLTEVAASVESVFADDAAWATNDTADKAIDLLSDGDE
ncbi:MAG: lamin tail domain-containing protein, partial [Planctomycetales bacterium]|nr:lamin tail domain-containing protein [Planctomycetales bacterium]